MPLVYHSRAVLSSMQGTKAEGRRGGGESLAEAGDRNGGWESFNGEWGKKYANEGRVASGKGHGACLEYRGYRKQGRRSVEQEQRNVEHGPPPAFPCSPSSVMGRGPALPQPGPAINVFPMPTRPPTPGAHPPARGRPERTTMPPRAPAARPPPPPDRPGDPLAAAGLGPQALRRETSGLDRGGRAGDLDCSTRPVVRGPTTLAYASVL